MKKYSKYIITFVVGLLIGLVVFVIKDAFVLEDSKKIIAVLIDASFVPGILMVCFGLLVVSANGGTFDMLVFGTRQFFNLFRKKFNREEAQSFYEYRKAKSEHKNEFWYLVIIGLVYITLSAIFLIIYYNI